MAEETVMCVKLGKDLPAIDPGTPDGNRAAKMAMMFGGPELRERVLKHVSLEAWKQWQEYMLMVMNEFRLDPTSDESNAVLGEHMEKFFFENAHNVPGYVPPEQKS